MIMGRWPSWQPSLYLVKLDFYSLLNTNIKPQNQGQPKNTRSNTFSDQWTCQEGEVIFFGTGYNTLRSGIQAGALWVEPCEFGAGQRIREWLSSRHENKLRFGDLDQLCVFWGQWLSERVKVSMHRGPDAYYPWKILNLGVLKWLSKLIEDRHADLFVSSP